MSQGMWKTSCILRLPLFTRSVTWYELRRGPTSYKVLNLCQDNVCLCPTSPSSESRVSWLLMCQSLRNLDFSARTFHVSLLIQKEVVQISWVDNLISDRELQKWGNLRGRYLIKLIKMMNIIARNKAIV